MNAQTITTVSFYLLAPANGDGPSHLRIAESGKMLCGVAPTARRPFQTVGIVTYNSGSCADCRTRAARFAMETLAALRTRR